MSFMNSTLFRQITATVMVIAIAKLTVFFNNPAIMWWFIAPAIVATAEPDGKDGKENDRTTSE